MKLDFWLLILELLILVLLYTKVSMLRNPYIILIVILRQYYFLLHILTIYLTRALNLQLMILILIFISKLFVLVINLLFYLLIRPRNLIPYHFFHLLFSPQPFIFFFNHNFSFLAIRPPLHNLILKQCFIPSIPHFYTLLHHYSFLLLLN